MFATMPSRRSLVVVSQRLKIAVKTAPSRQYVLARRIRVHPSVLSAWLNQMTDPRPNDPRVIALGRLVGVPADECFEAEG
jgi:hypothetical protein